MSPWYGFELYSGAVIVVEVADRNPAEAIAQAEAESGSRVSRGRLLDGFDNDAPEGRAELMAS
jgi:hypothetical protein